MQRVFADDVVLRPVNGQWLLHSAGGAPMVITPGLLAWLGQFARVQDRAALLAQVPVGERVYAQRLLEQLEAAGALVDPTDNTWNADTSYARSQQLLQQLPAQLYRIAADVQGLGPFAEQTLYAQDGSSVCARLFALGSAMDGLSKKLAGLRSEHVQRQAHALGLSADSDHLMLHLGCGPVRLDGFVNIDIFPAPLAMNVLWGLPFDDGQARIVYLSHLLEHLFYPTDVQSLLSECARVLAPGGLIRVVVPDIARCLRAYQENDSAFFEARRESFSWWPEDATPL
jgi:SAM-dependent methyltransferase